MAAPVHVLVDLENNQPTLDEVKSLVPDMTDVWLFHSGRQSKHLEGFESLGPRQMAVPISRPGKNSLDFHLSFYLGYIAARNPGARLVVVAIDGGYAPMIEHAVKTLGFDVQRVSMREPRAEKVATAPSNPVAKKAPAKKGVPKSTAKKVPLKKAPAKKAAAKKAPAKNGKAPQQKASAKKAKKRTATASAESAAVGATDKVIDRLIKGLRKMGDKAPARTKAYRQHLKSMLGKDTTEHAVELAAEVLAQRGVAKIDGAKVTFDFTSPAT